MKITKLIRILMVEDSEADAELIRFELDRGGLEHFHRRVSTEPEFLAALESREWDVILCDYHLPGFGGLKALEMLKARELDIPFILISGTIGEDVAVEAVKAGAHDYLIKGKLSRITPIIYRERVFPRAGGECGSSAHAGGGGTRTRSGTHGGRNDSARGER